MKDIGNWIRLVVLAVTGLAQNTALAESSISESLLEQSQQALIQSYQNNLANFEQQQQDQPDNRLLEVERCRYIRQFYFDEASAFWVDQAEQDYQQCSEAILQSDTTEPEYLLFQLEDHWGDDAAELVGRILAGDTDGWTERQSIRLYEMAADRYKWSNDTVRAGPMALKAFELGGEPRFAIAAAEFFAEQDPSLSEQLLSQVRLDEDQTVLAADMIDAWVKLGFFDRAYQQYQRWQSREHFWLSGLIEAKIKLADGRLDEAGLTALTEQSLAVREDFLALFDFAMEHTSAEQIAMVYRVMQRHDVWLDPIFRERIRMLHQHPDQFSLTTTDLVPMLIIAGVLFGILLLPGLIFVPVHYRSLIRQRRGERRDYHLTRWNLRHAWIAVAALVFLDFILAVCFDYRSLWANWFGDSYLTDDVGESDSISDLEAARYLVWMDAGMALIMAFFVWGGRELFRLDQWGVGRTLKIALLSTVALFVIAFVNRKVAQQFDLMAVIAIADGQYQTLVIQAFAGLLENYGALSLFFIAAISTPVLEEMIFRGVLLNSLAKHLSFGWANLIQAGLFALVHEQTMLFPYYLCFGLIMGWMVRHSRSLLPSMLTHGLVNGIAVSLLILAHSITLN